MKPYFSVRPRSFDSLLCSQTPVVSTVSELKQNSPSSCSPSLLRFSPLLVPLPLLLSPFIFFFFPFICFVLFSLPFDAPPSTTAAPLNCPTSNSTAVQVDVFPRSPCTHGHARSQTEAELLNGAAAREISARSIIGKKNWQISSKTTVLKGEQGVRIKDSLCQVLGRTPPSVMTVWVCCQCQSFLTSFYDFTMQHSPVVAPPVHLKYSSISIIYTKQHPLNILTFLFHLVFPRAWKHEGHELRATLKAAFLGSCFHCDNGVYNSHERHVLLNLGPKCTYEKAVQKSKNNRLIGRTKGLNRKCSDGGKTVNSKMGQKSRSSQAGVSENQNLDSSLGGNMATLETGKKKKKKPPVRSNPRNTGNILSKSW